MVGIKSWEIRLLSLSLLALPLHCHCVFWQSRKWELMGGWMLPGRKGAPLSLKETRRIWKYRLSWSLLARFLFCLFSESSRLFTYCRYFSSCYLHRSSAEDGLREWLVLKLANECLCLRVDLSLSLTSLNPVPSLPVGPHKERSYYLKAPPRISSLTSN